MAYSRPNVTRPAARNVAPLALALGLVLAPASPAHAQPAEPAGATPSSARVIRVDGVGEVEVEPDRARLWLAVETEAADAEAAAAKNRRRMQAVIDALEQAGVAADDIDTLRYDVHPRYAPSRPEGQEAPKITGYTASNVLDVRVGALDRVGALLDTALKAGANRVERVAFELADPAAAQQAALREAVARARASAAVLAEALGVALGPVVEASTSAEPVHFPMARMAMAESARGTGAPTPVRPQAQTVQARVSLSYRIAGTAAQD